MRWGGLCKERECMWGGGGNHVDSPRGLYAFGLFVFFYSRPLNRARPHALNRQKVSGPTRKESSF